jgi:hypothetical protein
MHLAGGDGDVDTDDDGSTSGDDDSDEDYVFLDNSGLNTVSDQLSTLWALVASGVCSLG